jgi:hypothetical protein
MRCARTLTLTLSRSAGEGKHSVGTRDARGLVERIVCPRPPEAGEGKGEGLLLALN